MMRISPLSGLTANWMFEPPVSTPTLRMINRHVAHRLIFAVGQRLGRGHCDRIAGVHAIGFEVFQSSK